MPGQKLKEWLCQVVVVAEEVEVEEVVAEEVEVEEVVVEEVAEEEEVDMEEGGDITGEGDGTGAVVRFTITGLGRLCIMPMGDIQDIVMRTADTI